ANKKTNPDALIKARKILDSILNNNIDHFTNKLATYQKQNILIKLRQCCYRTLDLHGVLAVQPDFHKLL
uniref:hypothetical protein n=1 Tax=uncultured Rubinisphaera sp. TaxID=1678686 RepID=UPI0030DAA0E5